MKCPECGSNLLKTYYTDVYDKINCKSRRRICAGCGHRFNTVELIGNVRVKDEDADKIEIADEYEQYLWKMSG